MPDHKSPTFMQPKLTVAAADDCTQSGGGNAISFIQKKRMEGNSMIIQRQALPDNLAAYPESDRERVRISWMAVKATGLLPPMNESFGTTAATAGGAAVTNNKPSGTLVFGTTVPASPSSNKGYDVRHGLSNIANFIEQTSNTLPLNHTMTLTLNLIPYGGASANYRFTYFQHITGTGRSATTTEITLIEQLGAATAAPVVANPGGTAKAGNFNFGGQTFTLGAGWSLLQQAVLNQALALVPANGITQLAGATFDLGGTSTTEEGHYDEPTNTITIRTSAFDNRLNAYQGGNDAIRIILHEIGHAIDRRPVRQAWATFAAAGQPTAGRGALTGTRSLSGSSYVFNGTTGQFELREGAAATAFRTAVIQDRRLSGSPVTPGISDYSATNWEENFAEAFSFYTADRALFQQLRPHTFQYFSTNYP